LDAKKRINDASNFPIDKLKKIFPFLTQKYPQSVGKAENDLSFLEEEKKLDTD
jgi:hypothetical protein